VRSDAIDQLVSGYLALPVKLSWEGSLADSLRGTFEGVRVEIGGIATAWLPLERLSVSVKRAVFTPGLPASIVVEKPEVAISVGQRDLDRWLDGFQLPFRLRFGERGLIVNTELAGVSISEFETTLEIVRGWFVLRPQRASILGLPSNLARLFRAYLPLPPLSPEARLVNIEHAERRLTLHFAVSDFEEQVSPGMLRRLRKRLLPWVG
jgi:hypothetical protein